MTNQKVSLERENKPEKGYRNTKNERNGIDLKDKISSIGEHFNQVRVTHLWEGKAFQTQVALSTGEKTNELAPLW